MIFPCFRAPESGLLIVNIEIDRKFGLIMVVDTGATHTTIDSNALCLAGYDLKDSMGIVSIETANGIIETDVFRLRHFASLGLEKENFSVQVYDFFSHGIVSGYNGLLGLDFSKGKLCLNLRENTIEIG